MTYLQSTLNPLRHVQCSRRAVNFLLISQDAQRAIAELNDTELMGRLIFVREDREGSGGSYLTSPDFELTLNHVEFNGTIQVFAKIIPAP